MDSFLRFLEYHLVGIFLLVLILFSVILIVNWFAWIFAWGRFQGARSTENRQGGFFYLFADFIVKLINDFRHFLALVLVSIFASSLFYVITQAKDVGELQALIQTVMATLGTLVGSIVGYYFGESAVKRSIKEAGEIKEIEKLPIQKIEDAPAPQQIDTGAGTK